MLEMPDSMKIVPTDGVLKQRLLDGIDRAMIGCDSGWRPSRAALESLARNILVDTGEPLDYLGWTMVLLGSRVWRERVTAVPYERRLLLLPHCMRHSATCPAEYTETELLCRRCGACSLPKLLEQAESLGYNVLIAEGTPIVMREILAGRAEAILGIGCLTSLEKAFEKLYRVGIPAMAVPLDRCGCKDTTADMEAVRQLIALPYVPRFNEPPAPDISRLRLHRATCRMFESPHFDRLFPPRRIHETDFLATTESLGREFLTRGGKYYRPFITLAVYAAAARWDFGDNDPLDTLPEWVAAVSMAMEIFHKASLIHDDIEDGDDRRYGKPSVHTEHGDPIAINLGDYLLGVGYRQVARQRETLGDAPTAAILAALADAHARLAEGQGMELLMRRALSSKSPAAATITLDEVLKVHALKTAPAFEAALLAGLYSASLPEETTRRLEKSFRRFAKHLGVGFQVRNDLDDLDDRETEGTNRRMAGRDIVSCRPTLLSALASSLLPVEASRELYAMLGDEAHVADVILIYERCGAVEAARRLVRKYADRARTTIAEIDEPHLRELLEYFVTSILE